MQIRRALIFSGIDRYSVYAINLALLAVAARLLTPKDIGIFVAANTLVMIAGALRDFGISAYLIQAQEIIREEVQTAFTISLILSVLVAVVFYESSGAIARFYAEPGLARVLLVASSIFLIDTLFYPQYALLRRDMAFGAILVVDLAATIANFITFCALALLGLRYMSLAWGAFVNAGIATAVAFSFRPYFWVYRPNLHDWKKFLNFGKYSVANGFLTVLYSSLPQLVLGHVLSFGAVGLYSRASTLCQMPERLITSALQPVLLPALSARTREVGSLKEAYLRGLGLMTAVQWSLLLCIALLADPIVRLFLGAQWLAAAPLLRIMALASLTMFPVFLTFPLLVAMGRIKEMFVSSLVALPPSGLLIVVAANIGLRAVAMSMILTAPFQGYVALWFIRRRVPFTWAELLAATRKSAIVALCAALVPAAAVTFSRDGIDLPLMFGVGVGAGLGWLAGLRITSHPLLADEIRTAAQQIVAMSRTALRQLYAAGPRWGRP